MKLTQRYSCLAVWKSGYRHFTIYISGTTTDSLALRWSEAVLRVIRKWPFRPVFNSWVLSRTSPPFSPISSSSNATSTRAHYCSLIVICVSPVPAQAKIKSRGSIRGQRRYEKRERQREERKKLVRAHTRRWRREVKGRGSRLVDARLRAIWQIIAESAQGRVSVCINLNLSQRFIKKQLYEILLRIFHAQK